MIFDCIWEKHEEFYGLFVKSLCFTDNKCSAVISLIGLMYCVDIGRNLLDHFILVPISDPIIRGMIFHFAYFYFTKGWFFLMVALRIFIEFVNVTIKEQTGINDNNFVGNFMIVYPIMIFLLTCAILKIFGRIQMREGFEFFVWVSDPEIEETEIGPAAALLGVEPQLPRIIPQQGPSYQTLYSNSTEAITIKASKIPRYCRSELITSPLTNTFEM